MAAGWGKRGAASLRALLQAPIRAAADVTTAVPPLAGIAAASGASALASPAPRHLAAYSPPWSFLQQRWTTGAGKGVPVTHSVTFPKEYRSRVSASAVVTHKCGPVIQRDLE